MVISHFDYFKNFDEIVIYYDEGQDYLSKILHNAFSKSLKNYRFKEDVCQAEYRLLQCADPDYDGETFRSKWQDYRENTHNDNDPLRVITWAKIQTPTKEQRKICVKAVDVFGFESVVVKEI